MPRTQTRYTLILLEKDSDEDRTLLTKALAVYVRNVAFYERTATNEISYWFERYNEIFEDKLLLFAFLQDEAVVGFAEAVFFIKERILAVDYFAVKLESESNSLLSEFIEQVRALTERIDIDYDFIVTELSYNWQSGEPGETEKIWITILKMHGFKVARAPYIQPPLGTENHESGRPGALMIFSKANSDHLKLETYLSIVDTLFYKHYLRWYEPFLGKGAGAYRSKLKTTNAKIKTEMSGLDLVDLNGSQSIIPQARSRGMELSSKSSEQLPMTSFIIPSTIAITVNIIILSAVIKFVELPPSSAMAIMIVSVVSYISIISVVSKEGAKTLGKLIQLIKELARRPK